MRTLMAAAALVLAPATLVSAQTAPTPSAATAPMAGHYGTTTTEIGVLLDDPAAKAVIEKNVPGMTTNDQIDMARAMTLKDIQQYSPDQMTDKVLATMDAEFAKLPAKPASK